MHRRALLALLGRYLARHPGEAPMVERVRALVRAHADCFLRTCRPGHITASAWILSADRRHFLMTHHRKLGRWLQLGGHADGDLDVEQVVLREAREESGMARFEVVGDADGFKPIDVDVHRIPAHGRDPEHEHHDIRFLLVAAPGQAITVSDESHDVRWFPCAELGRVVSEPSILRMAEKAAQRIGGRRGSVGGPG